MCVCATIVQKLFHVEWNIANSHIQWIEFALYSFRDINSVIQFALKFVWVASQLIV